VRTFLVFCLDSSPGRLECKPSACTLCSDHPIKDVPGPLAALLSIGSKWNLVHSIGEQFSLPVEGEEVCVPGGCWSPLTSPFSKWYKRGEVALCRRQALREAWKSVCNEQGCGSRNGEKAAAPGAAEQQDSRLCSQARRPPSGCAEPRAASESLDSAS